MCKELKLTRKFQEDDCVLQFTDYPPESYVVQLKIMNPKTHNKILILMNDRLSRIYIAIDPMVKLHQGALHIIYKEQENRYMNLTL